MVDRISTHTCELYIGKLEVKNFLIGRAPSRAFNILLVLIN